MRPRFEQAVLIRRHRALDQVWYLLTDFRSGARVRLFEREWAILRGADGTRTPEELLAHAGARDEVSLADVEAMLLKLAHKGIIALEPLRVTDRSDLVGIEASGSLSEDGLGLGKRHLEREELDRLEVVTLPETRFACDGRGSCCRLYEAVPFRADDITLARRAFPDGVHGDRFEELFVPIVLAGRDGDHDVTAVDGACAFLEPGNRCGIHARLGAAGKPTVCRLYPWSATQVGQRLELGLHVECACALASFRDGPPPDGEIQSILDGLSRRTVDILPDRVRFSPRETRSASEYVTWRDALLDELRGSTDPVRALLAQAATLLGRPPLDGATVVAAMAPLLARVHELARVEQRFAAQFLGDGDLRRVLFPWFADVVAATDGRALLVDVEAERYFVRCAVFAHELVGARQITVGLTTLALLLLIARQGRDTPHPDEPALDFGLTTVAFVFRSALVGQLFYHAPADVHAALGSRPTKEDRR